MTARGIDRVERVKLVAAATGVAVLVVAPWTALNATRFEERVLVSTNDGITLAGANCASTYRGPVTGGWMLDPCVTDAYAAVDDAKAGPPPPIPFLTDPDQPCFDEFQARLPCFDASQVSKVLGDEGLGFARDHVDEVPRVVLARNLRVWGLLHPEQSADNSAGEGRSRPVVRIGFWWTWLLLVPSVIGGRELHRRGRSVVPFLAYLAVVILSTSALTGGTVRLRLAWDIAACVLVGVAVEVGWRALERRGDPARAG